MRPAPGPIPSVLPSLVDATRSVVYLLDMPRERLGGFSLSQLVNEFSGGGLKWLTGSTVWLPAVFGKVDTETDLDVVFETKDDCERFCRGVTGVLTPKGYFTQDNVWGSRRFMHPDGKHIIDAWALEDDESIAELLLTYPNDYQRCAFNITWSGSTPAYLTRIIKTRTRIRESASGGGYRRARVEALPAPGPVGTVAARIDRILEGLR